MDDVAKEAQSSVGYDAREREILATRDESDFSTVRMTDVWYWYGDNVDSKYLI